MVKSSTSSKLDSGWRLKFWVNILPWCLSLQSIYIYSKWRIEERERENRWLAAGWSLDLRRRGEVLISLRVMRACLMAWWPAGSGFTELPSLPPHLPLSWRDRSGWKWKVILTVDLWHLHIPRWHCDVSCWVVGIMMLSAVWCVGKMVR